LKKKQLQSGTIFYTLMTFGASQSPPPKKNQASSFFCVEP